MQLSFPCLSVYVPCLSVYVPCLSVHVPSLSVSFRFTLRNVFSFKIYSKSPAKVAATEAATGARDVNRSNLHDEL